MWSIGVICYVLLSGLSPFMGEDDTETYNNITKAEFDFNDESFLIISNEAKDFISKLLVKDMNKRMLAHECLNHSWLNRCKTVPSSSHLDQSDRTDQACNGEKVINTKNLRRFVIRRRWQKAVNALLAIKRFQLMETSA